MNPNDKLTSLNNLFDEIYTIKDPFKQSFRLVEASKSLDLDSNRILTLFESYCRKREMPSYALGDINNLLISIDNLFGKLINWLKHLSLFQLLEYVGRLAILGAIISFFVEQPHKKRELQYEAVETIEKVAEAGKKYSGTRFKALELLNSQCVNLDGINLKNADLTGVKLNQCSSFFRKRGASLMGSDLSGAILDDANLRRIDLRFSKSMQISLVNANLAGAKLQEVDFTNADLFGADLSGADLTGANLTGADLSHANLTNAILTNTILDSAKLIRTDLTNSNADKASFKNANLSAAILNHVDFFRADFYDAKLINAISDENTSFEAADFECTNLSNLRFSTIDQIRSGKNYHLATMNDELIDEDLLLQKVGKTKKENIGIILNDEQEFFEDILRGAEQAAKISNVNLQYKTIFKEENNKIDVNRIELEELAVSSFIENKIDALVLIPQHEQKTVKIVKSAFEQGVVVGCYDHCINIESANRYLVSSYGSDQYALGYETGKYLASWSKKHFKTKHELQVGIIKFCDFESCYYRVQGFRQALNDSKIKWHEVAYRTARDRSASEKNKHINIAMELLNDYPDLEVIWSANEMGTRGAVEAVREKANSKVKVFGTDITKVINTYLEEDANILQAVTGQDPVTMGKNSVLDAVNVLRNGPVKFKNELVQHKLYSRSSR